VFHLERQQACAEGLPYDGITLRHVNITINQPAQAEQTEVTVRLAVLVRAVQLTLCNPIVNLKFPAATGSAATPESWHFSCKLGLPQSMSFKAS
jgi:hypothetical protein